MAALLVVGIAVEQLVLLGVAFTAAVGLWVYGQKPKTETQAKAIVTVSAKRKKDEPEEHNAWQNLQPFQGKTRRGYSSKGKLYYYQLDKFHNDEMQVYKCFGSTCHHMGAKRASIKGPITKPPADGRTISL